MIGQSTFSTKSDSWPQARLRHLPACCRCPKYRKPASPGSKKEKTAFGHTQEQFLVKHSWQLAPPQHAHTLIADRQDGRSIRAGSSVVWGHTEGSFLKIVHSHFLLQKAYSVGLGLYSLNSSDFKIQGHYVWNILRLYPLQYPDLAFIYSLLQIQKRI